MFQDHWNPRIIGELNGQQVKLAKFKGAFIWHKHEHEDEDELFMCRMENSIWFSDITVTIKRNEMLKKQAYWPWRTTFAKWLLTKVKKQPKRPF